MFKNVKKEIITIPAQMSFLSQIRDFIGQVGRKFKYSDKLINSFKLVIDEACTNIIRHGYRDVKGGEITLKAIIRRQSLTIVVIDQGKSYDPRQANTPDLEKYINIGKKGGLGILMMRKLMDDVQYNITSRGNELRLTKQREHVVYSGPRALWENFSMRSRYTIIASGAITIIFAILFVSLYSQVDEDTLDEVVEIARAQSLSLADNSAENLQSERFIPLFELTHSIKMNYPNLAHESFIVDMDNNIQAFSSPLKGTEFNRHELPDENEIIPDSTRHFKLYKYINKNEDLIYDFTAEIHATVLDNSPIIGFAHIWVKADYINEKAENSKLEIILWLLGLLILTNIGIYFLVARIVQPFHSLADWVRQVGQGTVDEDEIDIDASDELGEIAQAFNQMTGKFREAQVNLMEQQRLQKELQVAQEIQHMLLPSDFPKVEGYDIASFYEAAKEVGGDLFDFVEVDDETIGICVADVSGKGVPGSLIMTMIRTALRLEARGNKNPAEVLSKVNRFVTDDMKRGMFVTMFYLVLDSRNRIINYASAGHNPMILYRRSTKQTYFLNPSGFPVGIQLPDIALFDKRIEVDTIRLREDDMLVLYTDGITEAMDPERELYREERFLDAIKDNSHYDVGEFVKQLRDNINNHTKGYPQNDDITYVAIKEKMMAGEVIFNIQKELFRLIEEEGVKVSDACDKMRVSQYMYRKYKKVREEKGYEGLKDILNESDFIEKKHISIEVKTKLYEVLRKNPRYGAKKISETLDTEEYGNTKLEVHRIYQELKKAKLNTRQKREAFVERGGKKRIKLPGTPLLTMDGEVILNYESAEQVVAEKRGVEADSISKFTSNLDDKKPEDRPIKKMVSVSHQEEKTDIPDKSKEKEVAIEKQKIEDSAISETQPVEQVEKSETENITEITKSIDEQKIEESVKPEIQPEIQIEEAKAEEDEKEEDQVLEKVNFAEVIEKELTEREEKEVIEEVKKIEKAPEEIKVELQPEPEIKKDRYFKDLEEQDKKRIDSFAEADPDIDQNIIDKFYLTVKDDFEAIDKTIERINGSELSETHLNKIQITIKIINKNPLLKDLSQIRVIFEQVIKGMEFLKKNFKQIEDKNKVIENIKEMLNYIKKENILANSNLIIEKVNELGIQLFSLEKEINKNENKINSDIALIRKKIADKRILKSKNLTDIMQNSGRD